ncbi:Membrane-associated lipoprotein precursor [Mycoplasmopsis citelli]|uniref:Membrane-associated lipoprotein n=1 Tax=Mycoplasmopsis citelli TaxID=171281 RepID=A0A449B2Z0_9BACT|nr:DUF31 family protein [Mycoplasmopsis citelli]VEU74969.1 Membrane-associated lipoprotein precursor [Mycoplasmopsis citelli]
MKKITLKKSLLLLSILPIAGLGVACGSVQNNNGNPTQGSGSSTTNPPGQTNPSPGQNPGPTLNVQEGDLGDIGIGGPGGGPSAGGGGTGGGSPFGPAPGPQVRIPGRPNLSPDKYEKLSVEEKNKVDLDAYTDALKQYFGGLSYTSAKSPIKNASEISDYDKKAQKDDQPNYESALVRNFSIVKDNKLVLNPISQKASAAYWDSVSNNRGLSRYLPNQKYKDIALQSFAITFNNGNELISKNDGWVERGTAWILDYELDSKGYPTKWYLATNLHVAAQLLKTTADTKYSNVANLQEEKKEYDKTTARIAELEKLYNEVAQPYAQKIKAIQDEATRFRQLRDQANNEDNTTEAKKYDELRNKELAKLEPIQKEGNEKIDKEWTSKYAVEYGKEKDKLKGLWQGTTKSIRLEHFNNETAIDQDLDTNLDAVTVDSFYFKPEQVKIVYGAVDFLNQSPKDYLSSDSPYKDTQEMADFAVLEFDFNSNDTKGYSYHSNKEKRDITVSSAADLAKIATSDFANWESSKKFKFAKNSLYKDYDKLKNEEVEVTADGNQKVKTKKINVNLLALGFPGSTTDNQIDTAYKEKEFIDKLKVTQSIWVNKPIYIRSEFQASGKHPTKDYGSGFSKAFGLRNFLSKPGISDYTITSPVLTAEKNQPFTMPYFKDTTSSYQGRSYINYGLGYTLGSWEPLTGASGSSVRTIDNEIVGINFAAGDSVGSSLTSLVQAFRSEGIDYGGFYGSYKLGQYDLIYGGGKDQRTSYRQALKEARPNIKTYLFPNGADEDKVPSEYKFSN